MTKRALQLIAASAGMVLASPPLFLVGHQRPTEGGFDFVSLALMLPSLPGYVLGSALAPDHSTAMLVIAFFANAGLYGFLVYVGLLMFRRDA